MTRRSTDPGGIRARFPGVCRICDRDYPAGTFVNWVRGKGAHIECWKEMHE